jgi:hypothetical protein
MEEWIEDPWLISTLAGREYLASFPARFTPGEKAVGDT